MTARPAWLERIAAAACEAPPHYFARFAPPSQVRRRSAVLMLFGPRYAVPSPSAGPSGLPSGGSVSVRSLDDPAGVGSLDDPAAVGSLDDPAAIGSLDDPAAVGSLDDPAAVGSLDDPAAVDIVLTERSATLRSHAGQVSFPGGALDPGDDGPVAAALRETREEVGVDPASVDVVASLPSLYLSPSGNSVVPVLAWWRQPGAVAVVDPAEVARVERVSVEALLHPANRFSVESPRGGWVGPAFEVDGLFVWGFTAMLLDVLFDLAGLTKDWDRSVRRPIPLGVSRSEPAPPDDPGEATAVDEGPPPLDGFDQSDHGAADSAAEPLDGSDQSDRGAADSAAEPLDGSDQSDRGAGSEGEASGRHTGTAPGEGGWR